MEEFAKALENSISMAVEKAVEKAFTKFAGGTLTQKETEERPKYYTRKDIEEKFGVSMTTVWRWEKEKKLKAKDIKGRKMYEREAIDRLYNMGEIGKYCKK